MERVSLWAVAAVLGTLMWSGCEGGADSNPGACVRGTSRGCQCATGQLGAEVCADDGSAFGMCVCNPIAGAGGTGTAGMSGTGGFSGTGGTAGTGGFSGSGGTAGTAGTGGTGGTAGTAGTGGTGGTAGTAGTGGTGGTAGTAGTGGTGGTAGTAGTGGTGGTAGTAGTGGTGGTAGTAGTGGTGGTAGENYGAGETGRMVGFTAAHNAVRARSHDPQPNPALPPLRWSTSLAATAQAYADELASNCAFEHSGANGLGENLAGNFGYMSTPTNVTEAWAGEEACWDYGRFFQSDQCDMTCTSQMNSNGCGHYTQIIWRNTTEVGCGVATCSNGSERWVCNYTPPGNYINQFPY